MVRVMNPFITSAIRLQLLTAATGIMPPIIDGLFKDPIREVIRYVGSSSGYIAVTAMHFLCSILFLVPSCCGTGDQDYGSVQVGCSMIYVTI